jgi:putative membrane protein
MSWINLTIIALFAAGTFIFAFQNIETITVSFLSFSVTVPVAVLVVIVYVLGAVTGGSLFALLRRSYRGSAIGS